jgi:protein-disulfide isomerase
VQPKNGVRAVKITRRDTLILAAATSISAGMTGFARADDAVTIDQLKLMAPAGNVPDHIYGNKSAKVTVIEYLSPTCPHCAEFNTAVFPAFKQKYIDTNKIAYIPRPFMRNVLDAAVFMLAEAAGDDKYEDVLNTYFKTQDQWVTSDKPEDAMRTIALQLGFTKDSFDKALTNQTLFSGLEKVRDQALNDFKVDATPTFFVNGKQVVGEQTLDEMSAVIDPLLG